MLTQNWKRLKSGTDVRGTALSEDNGPIDLTDEVVQRIAKGFVRWLAEYTGRDVSSLKIAVGRDSRLSGPRIAGAVSEALASCGVQVLDCGMASTPAMFMTTVDLGCDGSVQITASHHPFDRNGLKFFCAVSETRISGGLEGAEIEEILQYAQDEAFVAGSTTGRIEKADYMPQYAVGLRRRICDALGSSEQERPLAGMHIVVDAGNGAGGFYASQVLEPLGADVSGSQFLEPDGRFPNHIPNPENEEAMASVCGAVTAAKADLGIIFDTDVDRAGCVDAAGREINRNRLVALASAIVLEQYPGGTVVTDSITSDGLKVFIEQVLGGVHCRFKRGYRNVIDEAIRLNQAGISAPLAIETSGHAAIKDNYFLDDGAYLMTLVVIKAMQLRKEGKTIDDLLSDLPEPLEGKELRFAITVPDFHTYGEQVLSGLETYAAQQGWPLAPDSREGVRVIFDQEHGDGWALLRLSVHDPVMPLNIESNRPFGCRGIAEQLAGYLTAQKGLDCRQLEKYLESRR